MAAMDGAQRHHAENVIEEMEEEGRRTLQLAQGAVELGKWLHWWNVPTAIVTRNTQATVQHLHEKLWCPYNLPKFWPSVAREFVPPKPHPAALEMIAWEWDVALGQGLLMVGDSPSNDIAFGKAAGVSTALVDADRRHFEEQTGADFVVQSLVELPRILWQHFDVNPSAEGPRRRPPIPISAACRAASSGDVPTLQHMELKDLEASDEFGNTPLIWAAESGSVAVVEMLLAAGVDANAKGYAGNSAISRASRHGHEPILRSLLAAKVGIKLDDPNDKLQSPLHFAAFYQHSQAVQLLLDAGASTISIDSKGRTPADFAGDSGHADDHACGIRDMILRVRETHLK